jgi:uncharacterized protein with LGFP repeats
LQRGEVFWSPSTGANLVAGALLERWRALGGQTGALGAPTGPEVCQSGDCVQRFRTGTLSSSSQGTYAVLGAIAQKWMAIGAEGGLVGRPVAEERCGLARGGCAQAFYQGSITWSPMSGADWITDRAADAWEAEGGPGGYLGYPREDCQLNEFGELCLFQGGNLYIDYYTGLYRVDRFE